MTGYNSSYLIDVLNPVNGKKTLKAFIKYIKASGVKFDTVVCRGVSGLLVAPAIAQSLKKHLIVIRKPDGNHSGINAEGYENPKRYIIVDDFMCTGSTVRAQLEAMELNREGTECVALFFYRSTSGDNDFTAMTVKSPKRQLTIPVFSMYNRDDYKTFDYKPDLGKVTSPKTDKSGQMLLKVEA